MSPLAITCHRSVVCGKQTANRISLGSTWRDRQVPGSNKMFSPKSSLRPWLLLLTPGTSGTASVSDSGAGGWRGQELGVGAQGDRRQGSPHQVVERSAHCRPASGVDEPQAERRWVWPGASEWLCLVASVSPPCILLHLMPPLFQVLKLLHQSQC